MKIIKKRKDRKIQLDNLSMDKVLLHYMITKLSNLEGNHFEMRYTNEGEFLRNDLDLQHEQIYLLFDSLYFNILYDNYIQPLDDDVLNITFDIVEAYDFQEFYFTNQKYSYVNLFKYPIIDFQAEHIKHLHFSLNDDESKSVRLPSAGDKGESQIVPYFSFVRFPPIQRSVLKKNVDSYLKVDYPHKTLVITISLEDRPYEDIVHIEMINYDLELEGEKERER